MDAQQARRHGVEGAAPDALAGAAAGAGFGGEERIDTAQHLGRRPAREGEQKDAPRVGAVSDEVGDPVHERGRLAGACAGDDEEGPVAVGDGGELLGVELGEHGELLFVSWP